MRPKTDNKKMNNKKKNTENENVCKTAIKVNAHERDGRNRSAGCIRIDMPSPIIHTHTSTKRPAIQHEITKQK